MNKDVTTTTSKGMYIVLFSSDEKEVYLTLNQGAKYFKDKKLKDHDIVKYQNHYMRS